MSDQRLLTSYEEFSPEIVTEGIGEKKKLILKGILQKSDTLNQNGRIYPREILEREVRNYQKFIMENRALGELDHPDASVISMQKVSHIVRSAEMREDGTVYGTIEVLDTPCGKIVQTLVESKVKVGISSRGVGSTKKQGDYHVVQPDYLIVCWDIVTDPSTPNAFMLPEGRKISKGDYDNVLTRSDRIYRIANELLNKR